MSFVYSMYGSKCIFIVFEISINVSIAITFSSRLVVVILALYFLSSVISEARSIIAVGSELVAASEDTCHIFKIPGITRPRYGANSS